MKMTISKNWKSDEDFIRSINEYEGDYLPLDKDRLVLFVVDFLHSRNIEPTFDKIIVTTFKLFPKKFSLIGFPEYPDGKVINDCVFLHCTKTKGWLLGNAQTGYKLTDKGKYFLDETKKMLEGKIKITKVYSIVPRRKEVTFVDLLKKTIAYKKYIQNKKEEISEYEILESLKIPQSSKKIAEEYIKKYFDYANRINDHLIVEFLEFIKKKLRGNKNA